MNQNHIDRKFNDYMIAVAATDQRLRDAALLLDLCTDEVEVDMFHLISNTVADVAYEHVLSVDGITEAWDIVHKQEGLYE